MWLHMRSSYLVERLAAMLPIDEGRKRQRDDFWRMKQDITFGIIGGYGATGAFVAAEVHKSTAGEILIGGRQIDKAKALASQFDGRTSAAYVDVLDTRSLDFCSRCRIIINCAGPVMLLQDRVAQAAFRSRSHYVDLAGLTFVKERMTAHARDLAALGLSFVVSAGWMPGISELVAVYANAVARSAMNTIESLTVYFTDSGEWSDNALRDGAWYVHQAGLRSPSFFRKGRRTRATISAASRKVDLGNPIGRLRFGLMSLPELDEIGRRLTDCDTFIYSYLSGLRTAAAATLIALVPLPDRLGVRLLRNIFRRNRLPVDDLPWHAWSGGLKCVSSR